MIHNALMSPYGEVWKFTRERLVQSFRDLTPAQLTWRPFREGHNIGEMLYHVAGVECWFGTKMTGLQPEGEVARLVLAARASYITDEPSPFGDTDMNVADIEAALARGAATIEQVITNPTAEQLSMDVETVIGPVVPGVACLWRVAQHAAYHTGQIWTYRQNPGFPN